MARVAESLGGVFTLEHDTKEWSVDIGFLDHQLAIEVSLVCIPTLCDYLQHQSTRMSVTCLRSSCVIATFQNIRVRMFEHEVG